MAKLTLETLRKRFQNAVQADDERRRLALEDYEFKWGRQWDPDIVAELHRQKRSALTINKIAPMLQIISGYQRLNRYDPDFLPLGPDDTEKCNVARAVWKWQSALMRYDKHESEVFDHGLTGGMGWFETGYDWDYERGDGRFFCRSVSPFDLYLDPECREMDLSDAKYICRASWQDKDELAASFPEHEAAINAAAHDYDQDETATMENRTIWYDDTTSKLRVVTVWYRTVETQESYDAEGRPKKIPLRRIRFASLIGSTILEDEPSPYDHNLFPFVLYTPDWDGEGDVPRGVVRQLKDPQRELNKVRSQIVDLMNRMGTRGHFVPKGGLDPANKRKLEQKGSTPGVVIEHTPGQKPEAFDTTALPTGLAQLAQAYSDDIKEISSINEEMLGQDVPASASGRAIELKQQASVTSIAKWFDALRDAKMEVMKRFWGHDGRKGLFQQYMTDEKVVRLTKNGDAQEFARVNEKVPVLDANGQPIMTGPDTVAAEIVNDLSLFEFDITISDTPSTPSSRTAAFWKLLELIGKIGPDAIPPDVLIDASDLPQKEQIKERMQQAQQMAAQAQAAPPGVVPPQGGPTPQQMQGAGAPVV